MVELTLRNRESDCGWCHHVTVENDNPADYRHLKDMEKVPRDVAVAGE